MGQTFWVLIHEQLDRLQEGDRFYYIDRIGDMPVYNNFISNLTFGDIVTRNTGMTDLPLDVFSYNGDPVVEDNAANTAPVTTDTANTEPANTNQTTTDPVTDNQTQTTTTDTTNSGNTGGTPQTDTTTKQETENQTTEDTSAQQAQDGVSNGTETETETNGDTSQGSNTTPEATETETETTETETSAPDTSAPQDNEAPVEAIVESGTDMGDALVGAAGDDILSGMAGDDMLVGNAGDDMLFGGAGRDDMLGGDGADMLSGGAGSDHILGGDGDDMIIGGTGSDILMGNAGDDTFIGTDGDCNDLIYGGEGTDTIDMASVSSNLTVRLGNAGTDRGSITTAEGGRDTIWSIENFVGGSGDDTIYASDAANVLDSGDGNDTFVFETAASAQGDHIKGLNAGDVLQFGSGDDMLELKWGDTDMQDGFSFSEGDDAGTTKISASIEDEQFEVTVSGRFDFDNVA